MSEVIYLEANGLRIITVYKGLSPIGFRVVNTIGEIAAESKTLYEAEDLIINSKKPARGVAIGSAAEVKVY